MYRSIVHFENIENRFINYQNAPRNFEFGDVVLEIGKTTNTCTAICL